MVRQLNNLDASGIVTMESRGLSDVSNSLIERAKTLRSTPLDKLSVVGGNDEIESGIFLIFARSIASNVHRRPRFTRRDCLETLFAARFF